MSCPDTYPDIISVRSFISKQFPTLLAIREIIADAIVIYPQKSQSPPPPRLLRLIRCKDTKKWAKNKIKTGIFVFGLFRRLFCGEKTGFGRRGTSIAGKAFVERGCDEVGLFRIPTS